VPDKTDDEYDIEIEHMACDLIESYGAEAASFARNLALTKAGSDFRIWRDIADAIQRIVAV
jgi:hypothetical protein